MTDLPMPPELLDPVQAAETNEPAPEPPDDIADHGEQADAAPSD